jgi:hypothetical protein
MPKTRQAWLAVALGAWLWAACGEQAGPGADVSLVDTSADGAGPDAPEVYVEAPLTVFGLEPARGGTGGGLEVRVRGAGLRGVVEVKFGSTAAAAWRTESDTVGYATTPAHPAGVVDVVFRDVDGAEARLESAFAFEQPVTVVAIEPARGSTRGGQVVRLSGAGFSDDAVVTIGARRALEVELQPDGSLTARTPEGAAGLADVFVRTGAGLGMLARGYEYEAAPEVRAVEPPAGPRWADTAVVISGQGFTADAAVSVGDRAATDVRVLAPDRIEATFPALDGPGGAVTADVVVTVAGGEAVADAAYTWLPSVADGPAVHAVVPASGPLGGGDVVAVVATGLSDSSVKTVRFGGVDAEVVSGAPGASVLRVRVPPRATVGAVDVEVSDGGDAAALASGYTYRAAPRLVEVLPNSGPALGGTSVLVFGEGFTADVSLSFGPLAAVDVERIDDTTLRATTPAGSPGMATVRVTQADGEDALDSGFHFTGAPALDAISPPAGSIAGGTLIRIHGAGFTAGTTVTIGGKPARDVERLGPTLLQARTLGGPPGLADVTLWVPGDAPVTATGLWLYFDPAAEEGFWGPTIDRNLDVTVYDRRSGARVEGATVIVGPTAQTPVRGYTNSAGQITFGRAGLSGPVTLTANKTGLAVTTLVGLDASHVAIGVDPIPQCSDIPDDFPCNPPPQPSASLDGSATGNFKGVKIPWGRCDDAAVAPGGLCDACTTDADCGGRPCIDIPEQGRYCTAPCAGPADCPDGYGCYSLGGDVGLACVPAGGELRVYCDVTNPSIYSSDPIPFPGIQVGPDGRFATPTRLGDYAVFCWSGIYSQGKFTPERLGVARHRGAYADGDLVVADVQLAHTLRGDVPVLLDRPALGSPFSESSELRSFIDLGADGVLELPPRAALGRGLLTPLLVGGLTGDLADTSYTFLAVVSSSEAPDGYSVTIRDGVTSVDADRGLRLGPDGFESRPSFPTTVRAITPADGTLLAVGDRGLITRNTGGDWWFVQPSGTTRALHAVAALPDGAAIAVGEAGLALHYDGLVWRAVPTGAESATLTAVAMTAPDRAWAAAGQDILAWDGAQWQTDATLPFAVHAALADPAPGADRVYFAGDSGLFAVREGGEYTVRATATPASLKALWLAPDGAVWAVGEFGRALRITATAVVSTPTPTAHTLRAVWGDEDGAIWAVGDLGTVLRWDGEAWTDQRVRDYRSTLYAIAGTADATWALGAHELVLGPMMGLPKQLTPAQAAPLLHEITWFADTSHPAQLVVATVDGQAGPCAACGLQFTIPYAQRSIYASGDTTALRYPDLAGIQGAAEPASGPRYLTVYRAWLHDGFDFNRARNNQLEGAGWMSYSVLQRLVY